MVPGAGLDLVELGLKGSLLPLVLAHLAQDGIFLVGLHINAVLACVRAAEAECVRADRGANLDVIFPWHVSVWMRASTVDGHSLPFRRRGRIVVPTGPLAVLHLDVVKRWGCDGSGFEPHRTGDAEWRRQERS